MSSVKEKFQEVAEFVAVSFIQFQFATSFRINLFDTYFQQLHEAKKSGIKRRKIILENTSTKFF